MAQMPQIHPTVVHMLAATADRAPAREALVCGDDRLSYRAYLGAVGGFARELIELGASGERVALVLGNSADICIAMFAAHAARAQVVPINPLYTARELEPILADSAPRVLIYHEDLAPVVAGLAQQLEIPHLVRIGGAAGRRLTRVPAAPLPEPLPEASALATLQYTGGTTGKSKGVDLTHGAIAINVSQREALLPARRDAERILCVMPLFHVYAVAMCLHNAAYCGATLVILPRFTPDAVFDLLVAEHISILAGSPTLFVGMIGHDAFVTADFGQLRMSYSGAAPLPEALLKRWEQATDAPVLEGYGQSESGPVISFNPLHGVRKPASVGIAVPETDLEIVDPVDGETILPAGTPGEIRIRGPQVMAGYRNLPEETADTLRGGWLYTGDIGELDADGYLYIRDRKKDMVLVSGYNVYPREIEEALHQHPAIREAAVIGVPDEYRGNIVKACIVPVADADVSEAALDAYCRENLAAYKVPRLYAFLDSLPKTVVGKIDKLQLRGETGL
jgi:long-chain acyl-CoA synthetase